ncbi:MAG: hypothetical protein HQM02_14160 [Magnetococcales bacterium]|nr:hypothetical protein [Magnetococcales bacterium]
MHNAKQDILALILAIAGLGLAVVLFNFFPDAGVATWQDEAKPFNPKKRGMDSARACIPCHDLTRERKITRSGPPLWGVVGQPAGATHGFKYSPEFLEMAKTGLSWNGETLDLFLKSAHPATPDDNGVFAGIPTDAERAALVGYLKTLQVKQDTMQQPLLNQSVRTVVPVFDPDAPELQVRRGRVVAEQCLACHDLTRDKKNIIGPYLWGVVGRPAGSAEQFTYSRPFLEKVQPDLRWTPHHLDQFLTAPNRFVPDTRMLFAGIPDKQRRTDLIAFLQTLQ